jgi:hypothetical protein
MNSKSEVRRLNFLIESDDQVEQLRLKTME